MKSKIYNFQNSRKTKTKEHKNNHISKRQRFQYFAEVKPKTKPTKTKNPTHSLEPNDRKKFQYLF